MNVLWVVNVPTPEACNLLSMPIIPYGGWLAKSSILMSQSECKVSLAFPVDNQCQKKESVLYGEQINYYPFPINHSKSFEYMLDLLNRCNPDIVHVYGTELPHSLTVIKACRKKNIPFVISIQGLVSVYSKHVFGNLPFYVCYFLSFRNFLRKDSVLGIKRLMYKRGIEEREILKLATNVIGRTHWDKACVKDINQSINYYPCNETLREIFYTDTKWSINNCDEYTVFISQGHYSVKGLHNVIEAIFILKKKFPKVRLFVSGKNTQYSSMLKRFFLSTYYDKYIGGLIKRFDLVNNIFFTGPLCENGVHARLLSSHVYVCSSSIENSPNSLGEAMILGVPCVTSFVGGIPSLVDNEKEVLFYQHDAPYMLAAQIERIFLSSELAKKLSKNSIARAYLTHDADANNENLLNIYNSCLEGGK